MRKVCLVFLLVTSILTDFSGLYTCSICPGKQFFSLNEVRRHIQSASHKKKEIANDQLFQQMHEQRQQQSILQSGIDEAQEVEERRKKKAKKKRKMQDVLEQKKQEIRERNLRMEESEAKTEKKEKKEKKKKKKKKKTIKESKD